MTSSRTRTALRYIGDLTWRTALLVLVVATAAFLHNEPAQSAHAAPAPLPDHQVRSGDVLALTAGDCTLLGLTSAGNGACRVDDEGYDHDIVAIATPDNDQPDHPAVALLLEQGFGGEQDDAISAIYVPVEWIVEDELGIWIVTAWGLARCEHDYDAARSCSGFELYT